MILAISTSTSRGSVALAEAGALLAEETFAQGKGHAEQLLGAIQRLLTRAGGSHVSRVLVDVGPGSFTGIRVGVATAIGLAHGFDVPCRGISSLAAMGIAALRRGSPAAVCVLDAHKSEVFLGACGQSGWIAEPSAIPLSRAQEVARLCADQRATLVGQAAADLLGLQPVRAQDLDLPLAATFAQMTEQLAEHYLVEPAPVYVRQADAMPQIR